QPPADARFYAGVDLHARSLFLAVLDRDGQPRLARNLAAAPEPFLRAVLPFRDGLVVGCECMHCWYWLADTCRDQGITFALRHAPARGAEAPPAPQPPAPPPPPPRPPPPCSGAATSRWPTPIPKSGGPCAPCPAPACVWSASGPSCTATSTPPAARPTCRPSP